jgi:hypothetical protein
MEGVIVNAHVKSAIKCKFWGVHKPLPQFKQYTYNKDEHAIIQNIASKDCINLSNLESYVALN